MMISWFNKLYNNNALSGCKLDIPELLLVFVLTGDFNSILPIVIIPPGKVACSIVLYPLIIPIGIEPQHRQHHDFRSLIIMITISMLLWQVIRAAVRQWDFLRGNSWLALCGCWLHVKVCWWVLLLWHHPGSDQAGQWLPVLWRYGSVPMSEWVKKMFNFRTIPRGTESF